MNYTLNTTTPKDKKAQVKSLKDFLPMLLSEKLQLTIAFAAIIINSGINLVVPLLIGHAVDKYIVAVRDMRGVLIYSAIILVMYAVALVASYIQTKTMGGIGQRILFTLRNRVFLKLQELPVAFFNQNKAGDLISRINNDTDKLNQFFSQALMQFIGNFFMIIGAGIFVLSINVRLGGAALLPAVGLLIFTLAISAYVKRKNSANLQTTGELSAEIQESVHNFKMIVAFNRRDFFRKKFREANEKNYATAVEAGIVNTMFLTPIYGFISNIAQLIVLAYGIHLIVAGNFTLGLLISFLTYVSRFYDPLRHIASLWAQFQLALASWDRISDILSLRSDLDVIDSPETSTSEALLEFTHVHFGYPGGKEVLHDISFALHPGKTYALVGPTGGGKTTTASLMARLYDPTQGTVYFGGRDIRSYTDRERTRKIGFILQDPFLFAGSLRDNFVYGNHEYESYSEEQLLEILKEIGLDELLARFPEGLSTSISGTGDAISLGQKQIIAFVRAVLRRPELLILDEATANIDTVTEQILENILKKLPSTTTKVIIAHRLNTIENADEIFFVNSGEIVTAGSFDHAVQMLMKGNRKS